MTLSRIAVASAVGAAALTAAVVAGPSLATTAAQSTTISFKELNKGGTFAFVDNAPRTKLGKNGPKKISAGDMIVFTNPLADATGKRIGQARATCTATVTTKKFEKAGFLCDGAFVLAG